MIDFEQHNNEMVKKINAEGFHYGPGPVIIPIRMAERYVELGMWEQIKRFVMVSMPLSYESN